MENTCIVFDFDCTITAKHLYYLLNDINNFISLYNISDIDRIYQISNFINSLQKRDGILTTYIDLVNSDLNIDKNNRDYFCDLIFGGAERMKLLKKFFKTCQEKNIDMHISSRGYLRNIIVALRLAGLMEYFTSIHCTMDKKIYYLEGRVESFNFSKDTLIFDLLKNKYTVLFYIDDTITEHIRVKKCLQCVDENLYYDLCTHQGNDRFKYYIFVNGLVQNTGGGMNNTEIETFLQLFSDLGKIWQRKKIDK